MKIMILTGRFGMGHWSAARGLAEELGHTFPEVEVSTVDLFDWAAPDCADAIYKGFSLLVNHGSGLYNLYYHATGLSRGGEGGWCAMALMDAADRLLERERPDAVLATHPLCAQLLSCYKKEKGSALPLVTCITDMSVHPEWVHPGTDCYLVGSAEVRDGLVERGVEEERILVTGIPVRSEFKQPTLRVEHQTKELLMMGGGLGLLPKDRKFYDGLNALPGVHTTILTGSNRKGYEALAGRWEHITVLSYTERVRDHMLRADLMVSKPGGVTLSEAIYTGLPILMPKPFLQQERNNAAFAVRHGIGRVASQNSRECLAQIWSLLQDPAALKAMSSNMEALRGQWARNGVEQWMLRLSELEQKGRCA